MDALLEGYRRFRASVWPERRDLFETLARDGQAPRALVIACADSRVDPAMIFAAAPGEIFTIRNVASLVPPYQPDGAYHGTSAALEFGVRVLEVRDIIVMGHGMCGGIRALLRAPEGLTGDFIAGWMALAAPARQRVLACTDPIAQEEACGFEAIKLSLEHLRGFPWVAERLADGRLRLHGASFDIRTGRLLLLGEDGAFTPA
ncbi:MAG: carbonic anhydrase [Acetobacteraceae bacterium]